MTTNCTFILPTVFNLGYNIPMDEQALIKDSIDLINKIARGDQQAFDAFYNKHSPLAYRLAVYMVRSPSDAEEVVQEVFVQIWKKAADYSSKRGNPEAWVTMMTRSRSIDKLRSLRRLDKGTEAVRVELGAPTEIREGSSTSPLPSIMMESVLSKLKEELRAVLERAYFRGMTHEEIAADLAIPLGTAKSRLRDALRDLQKFMEMAEKGEEDYQKYVPIKQRKQTRLRNIPTVTAVNSGPVLYQPLLINPQELRVYWTSPKQ